MKTRLATGALVGAILMGQYEAKAQTNAPPNPKVIGLDDCVFYLAGAVIIAGIYSCWYHGMSGDCTNTIHPVQLWPFGQHRGAPSTNSPNSMPALHLNQVVGYPVNDDFGFNVQANITVQSSTDQTNWSPYLDTTIWESPVGHLLYVSSNGVPLWTNYTLRAGDGHSTNECPFFPVGDEPHRYFRLLSQ